MIAQKGVISIKNHIQTHTEWQAERAEDLLLLTRSELYLALRYLDTALSRMGFAPDSSVHLLATDGESLFHNPDNLLPLWQKNPQYIDRAYLHSILHCVFRHLWLRGDRERPLWDAACDILVEETIDALNKPLLNRARSYLRLKTAETLKERHLLSPAAVYGWLAELSDEELMRIRREYYVDDHRYWPTEAQIAANPSVGESWQRVGSSVQNEIEAKGSEAGEGADAITARLRAAKSRRGYAEFLRKFCALKEELHLDPDSFDTGLYTYGLSVYGNMPLIEPLESREEMRIEEFAIVIDTSFSTSGELVRKFLRETFTILIRSGVFTDRCKVRLLQCDDGVRDDILITSTRQMEQIADNFTIRGGGGTDFRPAFRYLQQLKEEGTFKNLRGLLYFTDGKGIYPKSRPPYPTAFVFAAEGLEEEEEARIPGWAMRVTMAGE